MAVKPTIWTLTRLEALLFELEEADPLLVEVPVPPMVVGLLVEALQV
jgi:hypothetical protein